MGSPERMRSSKKREIEEDIEVNIDIVRDDDEWVGEDKRKQRLSKSRQLGSGDDFDGLDGSGKRRSTLDRHESRKRAGGSSRGDSDPDDYVSRRESRSKQVKKKQEESTLDVLSSWYQDGDVENKLDAVDKPGSGGHIRAEEIERKKSSSKYPEQDSDMEKLPDRDSRDIVKKNMGREKSHGLAVPGRSHRNNRWDESDDISRNYENGEKSDARRGKPSDVKVDIANERERSDPLQIESSDIKNRDFEPVNDKGLRSNDRDERRVDSERKTRGRSEFLEEDSRGSLARDDTSNKERSQEHRQQRNPTRDNVDSYGRSLNADEDVASWGRDKSRRDVENSTSRTPEKIGRRQSDLDNSDMDYDRSATARRKELGKDGSYDDRSKGRDDNWSDRSWDRENAKDTWKRKQDKEARDNDPTYNGIRDWELPRRGRDRIDGRSGGRKDGNRTEAVKTSSKYGISNENYDVIEIQTKPFDYGREDSRSKNVDSIQEGEEFTYSREERSQNTQGSALSGEDTKDRSMDGDLAMHDQHSLKDDNDFQGEKSRGQKPIASNRGTGSQSSSAGSLAAPGGQEPGSYGRIGRGGRGRPTGRENQQAGIPVPLAGSTFGPLGLPPAGPMQSLPPNMSPAPGPMSSGVFIPPFQTPILWPGARGVDMNMLSVPPGLPPVSPSPLGPRFPNLGNAPNGAMMFNLSGPGRGMPPSMSGPNFMR